MKKVALVDWKGNIILKRYYILYSEKPGFERWPNLYLQQHVDARGIDGSSGLVTFHTHPWSAVAIILKGGYTELRDGFEYVRRGLCAYYIGKDTKHAVVKAIPNTWSLFLHWRKKKEWVFSLKECEKLCEKCEKELGVCERSLTKYAITDITNTSTKNRDGQTWMEIDRHFGRRIKMRQAAINKVIVKEVSPDEFFASK